MHKLKKIMLIYQKIIQSILVQTDKEHKVKKTVVGITIVGKDREGIVAAFTNFAFSKGGNIEKVNQNVIKRIFGMYLEVSFSKKLDIKKFDIEIQKL